MIGSIRLACLAGGALMLGACSTMTVQQANATAAAARAAPATETAPAPSAPAGSATKTAMSAKSGPVVVNDASLTQEEVKQLLSQRYKPVTKDGVVYYCRTEQALGSRFPQKVCGSGQDLLAQTRQAQEQTDLRQRTNSIMKGN